MLQAKELLYATVIATLSPRGRAALTWPRSSTRQALRVAGRP